MQVEPYRLILLSRYPLTTDVCAVLTRRTHAVLPWQERLEKTPAAQYIKTAHPHVENSPCQASMVKLMRHVIAPELNMDYLQFKFFQI